MDRSLEIEYWTVLNEDDASGSKVEQDKIKGNAELKEEQ